MDNRGDVDRHRAIREFLATRRAKVSPEQAGVQLYGGRRRVPGLRREEVAMLAGISTDYYVRLEKGKLARVSDQVLNAVAGALRLDEAERVHLFNLVRADQPNRTGPIGAKLPQRGLGQVRPTLQWMIDSMHGAVAFIATSTMDVVAINALGRALYLPMFDAAAGTAQAQEAVAPANFARFCFLDPRSHELYPDWDGAAKVTVAQLRTAAGRNPLNKDLSDLVGELATSSAEFRTRWAAHDVRLHRTGVKHFNHPLVGAIEVSFNTMDLPVDPGLGLGIYAAAPGSPSDDALRLLASLSATATSDSDGRRFSANEKSRTTPDMHP